MATTNSASYVQQTSQQLQKLLRRFCPPVNNLNFGQSYWWWGCLHFSPAIRYIQTSDSSSVTRPFKLQRSPSTAAWDDKTSKRHDLNLKSEKRQEHTGWPPSVCKARQESGMRSAKCVISAFHKKCAALLWGISVQYDYFLFRLVSCCRVPNLKKKKCFV